MIDNDTCESATVIKVSLNSPTYNPSALSKVTQCRDMFVLMIIVIIVIHDFG